MLGVGRRPADVERHDLRHAQQRRPLVFSIEDLELDLGPALPSVFRRAVMLGGAGSSRRSVPAARTMSSRLCATGWRPTTFARASSMAPRRPGRPVRPAAGGDVLPRSAVAADGPALRAGRDQRARFGCWPWTPPRATCSGRSNWPWRNRTSLEESQRRWAGASPSYADGILVCPTSAGAMVGVELATRSLLWGYCYSQGREQPPQQRLRVPRRSVRTEPSASHWIDGSVSIGEGRVLATPVESDWLYCLSLIDGKLLWKCPRARRPVRGLRRSGESRAGGPRAGAGPCGWPTASRPGTAAPSTCPRTACPAAAASAAATDTSSR